VFFFNKFGKRYFAYWFLFFWHGNVIESHLIKLRAALPLFSITTHPPKKKAPPLNH
jgi:hypothetical protein